MAHTRSVSRDLHDLDAASVIPQHFTFGCAAYNTAVGLFWRMSRDGAAQNARRSRGCTKHVADIERGLEMREELPCLESSSADAMTAYSQECVGRRATNNAGVIGRQIQRRTRDM
jgi:hypothetical protein